MLVCGMFSGLQLATTSGDTTVKIWDFANASCIQTFADHQKAGKYTLIFASSVAVSASI